MTENELIKLYKRAIEIHKEEFGESGEDSKSIKLYKETIKLIEEIQQYRVIGTVEECRESKERQKPKIPDIRGDGYDDEGNMIYDMYECPNCGKNYEVDYDDYKYCPECGQAINRRDLDKLV